MVRLMAVHRVAGVLVGVRGAGGRWSPRVMEAEKNTCTDKDPPVRKQMLGFCRSGVPLVAGAVDPGREAGYLVCSHQSDCNSLT